MGDLADAAVSIANLIYSYAERVDAGDAAGVGALFADATFRAVVPGGAVATATGADEVARLMGGMWVTYDDGTLKTRHITSNLIVEVAADARTATCRSVYTVLQAAPGGPFAPIISGRYHDAFTFTDGAWRFTDRLIHTDLVGDLSRHLRVNPYQ